MKLNTSLLECEELRQPPMETDYNRRDKSRQEMCIAIQSCSCIDDFVAIYDSYQYQSCLGRLRVAMGCVGAEYWSKHWVEHQVGSIRDKSLFSDWIACCRLISALYEAWTDPTNMSVSEEAIHLRFKTRRLVNIFQLILPIGFALASYEKELPGSERIKARQVLKQHNSQSKDLSESSQNYRHFELMSRPIVWFMDSDILGLKEIQQMRRWTSYM